MYDPIVGRFMQEDPIEFDAGDPNLSRYVGNSPTNATDPSGLESPKDWLLRAPKPKPIPDVPSGGGLVIPAKDKPLWEMIGRDARPGAPFEFDHKPHSAGYLLVRVPDAVRNSKPDEVNKAYYYGIARELTHWGIMTPETGGWADHRTPVVEAVWGNRKSESPLIMEFFSLPKAGVVGPVKPQPLIVNESGLPVSDPSDAIRPAGNDYDVIARPGTLIIVGWGNEREKLNVKVDTSNLPKGSFPNDLAAGQLMSTKERAKSLSLSCADCLYREATDISSLAAAILSALKERKGVKFDRILIIGHNGSAIGLANPGIMLGENASKLQLRNPLPPDAQGGTIEALYVKKKKGDIVEEELTDTAIKLKQALATALKKDGILQFSACGYKEKFDKQKFLGAWNREFRELAHALDVALVVSRDDPKIRIGLIERKDLTYQNNEGVPFKVVQHGFAFESGTEGNTSIPWIFYTPKPWVHTPQK